MTTMLRNGCGLAIAAALALGAAGCAAGGAAAPRAKYSGAAPATAPAAADGYAAKSAPAEEAPPPPPAAATEGAAPGSAGQRAMIPAPAPVPEDRPGLATHWGESRTSYVHSESFTRADFDHPSAMASMFYNDAAGARAMANAEGFRRFDSAAVEVVQGGVTISLKDGNGRILPGYFAGGKTFAIGEAGDRYTIVLRNDTPARFEAVVSVDGLDVLDGRPASFDKRGYLLNPHATVEIDGFRTSESSVAAFRFGSVRGSYAARKGDDRHVGVIGVAVFHERGTPMWPWPADEVERRRNANPFPGQQWATPPN